MKSPTHKPVEADVPGALGLDATARKAERRHRWRIENAEAIRAENEDIERNGLPLADRRLF